MATGSINNIPQIKIIDNAFTFEQIQNQTIQLNDYAGWILLDIYTNNKNTSVLGSPALNGWNWNITTGTLTLDKGTGAWVGVSATVVLIRP